MSNAQNKLIKKWILFPEPIENVAASTMKTLSGPAGPTKALTKDQTDKIQNQFIDSASILGQGFEDSMASSKFNYNLVLAINVIIVAFGVLLLSFSIYYSWVSQKFELFSAITAAVGVADFMALFLVNPQIRIRKNLADLVQMRMIYTMWMSEIYSAYLGLAMNEYTEDNIIKYQNTLNSATANAVTMIENNIGNDTSPSTNNSTTDNNAPSNGKAKN